MKLFSLWRGFCHRLSKYCGGVALKEQICWEDGHKTCPWARDRRVNILENTFGFSLLMIETDEKIVGCGLRCYGARVWNAAADGKCDNLMFHTSIYGSSVRSNLTVIQIATKIKPQMSKFLEIRLKSNCLVLATRNLLSWIDHWKYWNITWTSFSFECSRVFILIGY